MRRSLSAPQATIWLRISPFRYKINIGIREAGRLGMHLSPTIERNFVRGYFWARIRTCLHALSLWGTLCRSDTERRANVGFAIRVRIVRSKMVHAPIFVEKTNDTRSLPILVIFFVSITRLCDLRCVTFSADRVDFSEPGSSSIS
jgi:hypothetical protein